MKLSEFIRYESKGAYYIMASLLEKHARSIVCFSVLKM